MTQPSDDLWWLILITAAVILGFFFMFRKIVDRYCRRITSLDEKVSIWQTFPVRGWVLIVIVFGILLIMNAVGLVVVLINGGGSCWGYLSWISASLYIILNNIILYKAKKASSANLQ